MKAVETKKDFPGQNKNEDGWYASTRCEFCSEFYEKARPWICPHCWEWIQRTVLEYADEFRELLENTTERRVLLRIRGGAWRPQSSAN